MDDISLIVGARAISGWNEIRVTCGIERCPSDFDIALTERGPDAIEVIAQPGDACQLKLGADLVVTGYVDHLTPSFSAHGHSIRLQGRGKCQDLVDCSAEWPSSQISGASALGIAQRLAQPYGIEVYAADPGVIGPPIPQFNLTLGETAWDVIEQITRYAALLAYEQPDGRLVLAQLARNMAASGAAEGKNVQRAAVIYSMAERYSLYKAFLLSMDGLADAGSGGNTLFKISDPGVPRYRNLYMIAEGGGNSIAAGIARQRAIWDMNRRAGRSRQVWVEIDSWRDSAGTLWSPNTQAPIDLPSLKLAQQIFTISEVTFRLSPDRGTTAELTLMPPDALKPQPILLQPYQVDIPSGIGGP